MSSGVGERRALGALVVELGLQKAGQGVVLVLKAQSKGNLMHRGSCLCGAVRFEIKGSIPAPDACHCSKCRKFSGHYFVSGDVPRDNVLIHGSDHVTWYRSSEKVQRGFCSTCGASLFFDPVDKEKNRWIGIAMGAFDAPTETRLEKHIFVGDKGDYYDIKDGLPQNQN